MNTTRPIKLSALFSAAVLAVGLAAPVATAHGDGSGGHHGDGGEPQTHILLPDGFQPEGIATGHRHTAYLGSLANGDIIALDLRSGDHDLVSPGPGTPSVGLKLTHGLLYVAGGPTGTARVVSVRTGNVLATYTLAPAGAESFINDVILTRRAAWFTDSFDNVLYRVPLARHRGHHGHHGLPGQDRVRTIELAGDWVQNTGFNANGITTTPDRRALLVINSTNGTLYRVEKDGTATAVDLGGFVVTSGDGLLREGRTLYAVQNFLNQVAVIRLAKDGRSGRLVDTLTSPDFDVPTTIARSGKHLYLPNARFNTTPTPDTEYWVTGIDD